MAILVNRQTKVLIQGITGRSGIQAASELLDYDVKLVAGVTPGKGGQQVFGVPVFNSIAQAKAEVGQIDVSMVYVPPLLAYEAATEAVSQDVSLIHIFVEKVPVYDTCRVLWEARKRGVRILGPNSVGAISPGECKIGSIGGPNARVTFSKGPVGVISKSGGICSELGTMITKAGFGQSTVVGIGGDLLIGTGFSDLLAMYQSDHETKAVVAFGEVGGSAELDAAKMVDGGKFTKPLIVFLAGKFAESLPKDTALGHAGAIVGLEVNMDQKIKILEKAGVLVAQNFEDIPSIVKKVLK